MRVLLDECLPRKLKPQIDAEFVQTVPEAGWASKQNGELLALAEASFDVLLTNDQNIEHQQTISRLGIAVVVLVAPTNDIVDLLPLVGTLNAALKAVKAGTIHYIR